MSGPAVAAIASLVQITTSASASITHGSPAAVSADVNASTPSGIPSPVRGGPSWVIDRPLEVIGDTSTTPGSDLCAPAVVVPGSTRSGPSTAARARSLPRPFCTVATQVDGPTAPAIDSATSRLAQPLHSTMTASTGSTRARDPRSSQPPRGRRGRRRGAAPARRGGSWRGGRCRRRRGSPRDRRARDSRRTSRPWHPRRRWRTASVSASRGRRPRGRHEVAALAHRATT